MTIHVGGTSGKGSNATYLDKILSEAGYKVGLYTKPHLISVRERFLINGQPISCELINQYLAQINHQKEDYPITWFELTTALAFLYFAECKVDFGVIEVGMGGNLDATNVIDPELSVLTNVGLDHTEVLGNTIEEIAKDKVGIIKPGKPVICSFTQPSVLKIAQHKAKLIGAPFYAYQSDYSYAPLGLSIKGSIFDFYSVWDNIQDLKIKMLGKHQIMNASTAVAAGLCLQSKGYSITTKHISTALENTVIAGRMEVIQEEPLILVDGAHSAPKMTALAEGLTSLYDYKKKKIGILAFSKGHDAHAALLPILDKFNTIILTEFEAQTDFGDKRAQDVDTLAEIITQINPNSVMIKERDPEKALWIAKDLVRADDLICITGSIFLIGNIKQILSAKNGVNRVPNIT